MRRALFLSVATVLLFLGEQAKAQRFEKIDLNYSGFGGSLDFVPERILRGDSGNYYLAVNFVGTVIFKGQTITPPVGAPKGYFIAKLDSNFNLIWLRVVTNSISSFSFFCFDLELDAQGNLYFQAQRAGVTNFAGQLTLTTANANPIDILGKFSPGGQLLFVRDLPAFTPSFTFNNTLKLGPDGNLYVTGNIFPTFGSNLTIYLQRWSTSGVLGFSVTQTVVGINGSSSIYPLGLEFDLTGNPVLLIRSASDGTASVVNGLNSSTSQAVYLVSYSRINGSVLSTRRVFNFNNNDSFLLQGDIKRKANGNYVITTEFSGQYNINGQPIGSDVTTNIILLEFPSTGNNVIWSKVVTSPGGYEIPGELLLDSSENIYLCGFVDVQASFTGIPLNNSLPGGFIAKYQPNGVLEWAKSQTQNELNVVGNFFGFLSMTFDRSNQIVFTAFNRGTVAFDTAVFPFNTNSTYIGVLSCRPIDIVQPIVANNSAPCLGSQVQYSTANIPFTDFVWSLSSGGTLVSAGNQASIQWTSPGNYTITVVPQNSCGTAGGKTITVNVRNIPTLPSQLIGDTVVCFAGSRAYSVPATAGVSNYTWSLSGGGSLIPFSNNAIVNWAIPGSYQLSVTPSNDCGVGQTLTRTITVTTPPSQPAPLTGATDICTGSQAYSTALVPGTDYLWSLSSGGILNSTNNTATVNWTTAGVHTLTVTPVNGCSGGPSRNLTITVRQAPGQPSSIIGNSVICRGFQNYSIIEFSGVSYNWSLPAGGNLSSFGGSATVNWTQQGVFTLSVTPQNSCGTGPARSVLITVNDFPPSPGPILGLDSVCLGSQTYAVPAQGGVNYNWTLSGGGGLIPSGSSAVVNWTVPGTYTLTVTPVNTCGLGTQVVKQVFVRNTAATITGISGPDESCLASAPYSVPLIGGFSYNWGLTSGGTLTASSNTATVNWTSPGFHTLSVNTSDGCSRALLVQVRTVPAQPVNISGDTAVCLGTKPYVITTVNQTNYIWSLSGGGVLNFSQGASSVNWTDTGSYVLSVTPSNQCGNGQQRNLIVRVSTIPSTPSVISGSDSSCQEQRNYTVLPVAGTSYNWSLTGGGNLSSNTVSAIVNWTGTGVFQLSATPSNQCGSGPQRVKTILVSAIPQAPVPQGDTLVCLGSTVYRAIQNPNVQYLWQSTLGGSLSSFGDSAVVNWTLPGQTEVRLRSQNFCGTSALVALPVRVKTIPQIIPLITGDTLTCLGTKIYSISPETETGYSWNLSGGGNLSSGPQSATINWTNAGQYLLSVASSNRCGLGPTGSVLVKVIDIPVIGAAIQGSDSSCLQSQNYSVPIQSGVSYLWNISSGGSLSASANQATVNWQNTGSYTVSVQPLNQCGLGPTQTKTILVGTTPSQPTILGDTLVCLGSSVYRTPSVFGQQYLWNLSGGGILNPSADTAFVNWTNVGVQNLQLIAQNFCGASPARTISVRIRTLPQAVAAISGDTLTCLGTKNYTLPFQNDANWLWQLSGGGVLSALANNASINWTQNGLQTLSVTASNSCGSAPANQLFVRVIDLPGQPSPITGPGSLCIGNPQNYSVSALQGTTYNWSLSGGGVLSPSGNTAGLSMNSTGTFSLSVSPSNQCGIGPSRSLSLNVQAIPSNPSAITGDAQSCLGNRFYSTFGLPGLTYNWSFIGFGSITPSGNTATINWTGTGPSNVTVTASNFCGTSPATVLPVTIITLPSQPSAIAGDTFSCAGLKSYAVNFIAGTTYTWSLSSGGSLSSTGNQALVNWNNPGTHVLSVSPSNVCGTGTSRTLIVRSGDIPPQPQSINGNPDACRNIPTNFNVIALPGVSYLWTSPSASIQQVSNGQIQATWSLAGTYSLTVTPQNVCGTGSARILTVFVSAPPQLTDGIDGREEVCLNDRNEFYRVNAVPNQSYQWSIQPTLPFFNLTSGLSVNWTTLGSYTIQVVPSNACGSGDTVRKVVQVFGPEPKPTITFRNDTLFSSSPIRNQWFVNGELQAGIDTGFFVPGLNSLVQLKVFNPCSTSEFARFVTFSTGEPREFGIEVYPNPAQNEFTIQFPVNMSWTKAEIYNNLGKLKEVAENEGEFKLVRQVKDWNKGLYQLKLFTEFGVLSEKLVLY